MDILRFQQAYEPEEVGGLCWYNLDGLRIFAVNAGAEGLEDPMVTFLREVISALPCAAHMSLYPMEEHPKELFSLYYPEHRFLPTPVGSFSHLNMFVGDGRPYGVYFPRFFADDLQALDMQGEPLLKQLLKFDQPYVYIGIDDDREGRLRELFLQPPPISKQIREKWFHAVTHIVPLVLVGGHGEGCFHAVTHSPESLDLLRRPIERTENVIKETTWYQDNIGQLQWSDEPDEWCLVLPCGERGRRRRCN